MRDFKTSVVAVWREVVTPLLLIVWITTTLLVAFAGPFGTYGSLSFMERAVYWGGLITVSIALALVFRMFWRVTLKGISPLAEDGLVLVGLAILFGPIVANVNNYFWPETNQLASWPFATLLTLLIGCCAVALRHIVQDRGGPVEIKRDRLLDRIGASPDERLARISSDNHHIKVTTGDGEEYRILMRLRDAVADIDVEPGICVHRSHWVALRKISGVEVADGREVVRLTCGGELPVGPKYRSNLIGAGILSA